MHLVLGLGGKGKALFESAADVQTIVDPKEAAESAGLGRGESREVLEATSMGTGKRLPEKIYGEGLEGRCGRIGVE